MYDIPCGAVDKSDDPHSRIIHNYRYLSINSASIKDASQNVRVVYHIKRKSVRVIKGDVFTNADIKRGYRQLPEHPADHALKFVALRWGPS